MSQQGTSLIKASTDFTGWDPNSIFGSAPRAIPMVNKETTIIKPQHNLRSKEAAIFESITGIKPLEASSVEIIAPVRRPNPVKIKSAAPTDLELAGYSSFETEPISSSIGSSIAPLSPGRSLPGSSSAKSIASSSSRPTVASSVPAVSPNHLTSLALAVDSQHHSRPVSQASYVKPDMSSSSSSSRPNSSSNNDHLQHSQQTKPKSSGRTYRKTELHTASPPRTQVNYF
jgi:hypothetical protein